MVIFEKFIIFWVDTLDLFKWSPKISIICIILLGLILVLSTLVLRKNIYLLVLIGIFCAFTITTFVGCELLLLSRSLAMRAELTLFGQVFRSHLNELFYLRSTSILGDESRLFVSAGYDRKKKQKALLITIITESPIDTFF